MKKLFILLLLIPLIISHAQNLDSLYNAFLRVKEIYQNVKPRITGETDLPIKCGFGIVNQVKLNYDKFSPLQKNVVSSLLQRPTTDTSFVSPRGWFRIHYNKTGNDTPGYDIKEAAIAADSSYNYEVNILGYLPPPQDNGAGGDNKYDIYIVNENGGAYGGTTPEQLITDSTWTSFMDIDNDFGSNYNTHGINAARVTIAHELHHAIQMGKYIFRSNDLYYYELTSTSMEEFVYDNVNDYYYYMDSYFKNPNKAFSSTYIDDGYSRAIWNIFLRDRFGANIIRRSWELMTEKRALKAISGAIEEAGSDFKTEFNLFGQWTYFTGVRGNGKYFKEAAYYPLIKPTEITNSITVSSEAVSNNFYKMYYNSSGGKDSVITLITNSDVPGGIISPVSTLSFKYTLSTLPIPGGKKIAENFYSKLEPQSYILTEASVLSGNVMFTEIDYPFPQPFKYSLHNSINLPVVANGEKAAQLYIYSADMNLIFSGLINIAGNELISWNCLDNNGKKLNTGVYIYVAKSGDTVKKGKFVIQND
jgi:hypothetical protein